MYITRIAPSPTGMFHLGTARTALFNYLAAKGSNGKFILRIDDTDIERNKQEYTDIILQSLEWLGLEHDELYYQSQRTDLYLRTSQILLEAEKAFRATNGAIILRVPTKLPKSFSDEVRGTIAITDTNKTQIDGRKKQLVLVRGNGEPTYQFCSVVDDYYLMAEDGEAFIIRGVDHITNTPKQIAIWYALRSIMIFGSFRKFPKVAHIGLIHKDKKKLSKRDNAASLLWYKDNGYSPNAILNFILRMGWGCKEDTNKLLSMQEMIDMFLKGRMRAAPSNFDENKLEYYNRKCK